MARERAAVAGSESFSLLSAFLCCVFPLSVLLLFLLFSFVCCSVKLPLSRPTRFLSVSLHFPQHPSGRRGGHMALLLPAKLNYNTHEDK